MHYQCTAFIESEEATITTNDVNEFDRLLAAGGTMLCHPELFSQQDGGNDLDQLGSIPYVVQIPRDKLALLRSIPTDTLEGYETLLSD
ncbi:hypothetical protein EHV15_05395 [Paenibacillus oralis]|uniref:Uncharacterized protein n=1 Tax=Paenibacillus oralis TaxID=2490856 RepID=A0A3P3TYV0_9BACL|nr:hypothetical protein [Paenibacillus oralis]RRJ62448.1 hypothetical protein EHV15_05395 [Paenibacillus oralis]